MRVHVGVPASLEEAQRLLVDEHFPWEGARPGTWDQQLAEVHAWLALQTRPYKDVATALIARVEPVLAAAREALPEAQRARFLYRIDAHHLVKSPASTLEKMAREWLKKRHPVPPIGFDADALREFKDLGRFRIVANFLSDAEELRQRLEAPYDSRRRGVLTQSEQGLQGEFRLDENAFKDLVSLPHSERKSGERCFKALFEPRRNELARYKVEVQIVTVLQEAWDKKDHFLVYEQRRAGQYVDPAVERMSHDLSTHLYLADLLFDQLKRGAISPLP